MIFSSDLDRSLWLVMRSDRKHRNEIARLINMIPEEVFDKIKLLVDYYSSNKDDVGTKKFNKAIRNEYGYTYLYNVEISNKELKIKLSILGDSLGKIEENYELVLVSLSMDEIIEMDFMDLVSIGSYFWSDTKLVIDTVVTKCDLFGYELSVDSDQKIVVEILGDRPKNVTINLNELPSEINLSDLGDGRSIKRLIRGKKRG